MIFVNPLTVNVVLVCDSNLTMKKNESNGRALVKQRIGTYIRNIYLRLIYILIKNFLANISAVKGKLSDQKYHPFLTKPTNNAFALLKFIYGIGNMFI